MFGLISLKDTDVMLMKIPQIFNNPFQDLFKYFNDDWNFKKNINWQLVNDAL